MAQGALGYRPGVPGSLQLLLVLPKLLHVFSGPAGIRFGLRFHKSSLCVHSADEPLTLAFSNTLPKIAKIDFESLRLDKSTIAHRSQGCWGTQRNLEHPRGPPKKIR